MMLPLILIILLVTIIYYYLQYKYKYWERKGIPGPKPHFFVGNVGKALLLKTSPGEIYTDIYNEYPNEEMVGIYRTTTPVLMLRDPELIKEVTVRSFSHFRDNDIHISKKDDALFGRNVFTLRGEEWKLVRSQLTPGFSSGKIKLMYPIIEHSAKKLIEFIDNNPETTNGQGCEVKQLSTKYTLNNVAGAAFGLESKCFEDENSSFAQLARDFFTPGGWTALCFSFIILIPSLPKIFHLRFITKKVEKKLIDLVSQTVRYREENNIVRNDYLNISMQLKKTCKEYNFTDIDVAAHSAAFFFDGYETSAQVMSYVLFELARNPEAQSILRDEITKALEENEQKIPYDLMQTLPYLDGAVNETMRIHTPLFFLQKLCTKTFTFSARNGRKPVTIEKDTPIVLPVHGLHHDPKYYEDPELFKPERFAGENKEKLTKYTFLPLGEGPRACLGQRFGLLQIKVGVAYVIKNYEVSVNNKTRFPLKYDPLNALTSVIGGLWLNFQKIK